MASTLIQFRADDMEKLEAIKICDKLGINLQAYLRMCLSRLISENGIPFSMNVTEIEDNQAIRTMREISRRSAENGLSEMSLEEINAEIQEVRRNK
ncbi:type II toxin-antitoxin system RelB/DinJ family antitoxin [Pseudobutyrivibrio xylanivorans]|uniref:DNA-damage-inducible protein J n=1 Tax=Pseudobutyrivibrio xylanivorans DSM 14809 TaxID=1123012 RepID=A0A1M6DAR0_PSEXY|nr:type II toxin-antitoxin system RelB/DinJ family antitoxin [Pseudobutyrivibrio xylanivorans]SHI70324.1 DNA-damage-inducible protein J [Pseudobutyrivibrio xylanivorans DSM 14809]